MRSTCIEFRMDVYNWLLTTILSLHLATRNYLSRITIENIMNREIESLKLTHRESVKLTQPLSTAISISLVLLKKSMFPGQFGACDSVPHISSTKFNRIHTVFTLLKLRF